MVAVSHFGVDLVGGGFAALLPSIAQRLDLSATEVGVLVALYSVTALATQPVLGRFADQRRPSSVTALTAALAAVVLALSASAPNRMILVGVVGFGGLAAGVYHPAGAAALRGASADRDSSRSAMAWYSAAGMAGLAVGPPLVLLVEAHLGRHAVVALATPAVVAAVVLGLSGSRPALLERGAPVPVPQPRLTLWPLRWMVLAASFLAIATTTLVNSVPLWIADQPDRSSTHWTIGVALAGFSLAAASGGILGAAAIGRRPTVQRHAPIALLVATATLGLFVVSEPGSAQSIAALVVAGLLVGPAFPILLIAAQDAAPQAPAVASGLVMGLPYGIAGGFFVGLSQVHDMIGYQAGVLVGSVALVPAAVILGRSEVFTAVRSSRRHVEDLLICGCAPGSVAVL